MLDFNRWLFTVSQWSATYSFTFLLVLSCMSGKLLGWHPSVLRWVLTSRQIGEGCGFAAHFSKPKWPYLRPNL